MNQHLEVRTIKTNDINVTILIDYDRGTLSLVEADPMNPANRWKGKKYFFANRELNYMNGWINILEAMMAAVEEGKKLLEKDLAQKSAFKEEDLIGNIISFGIPIRAAAPKPIKRSKQKFHSKSEERRIKIMKDEKKKK